MIRISRSQASDRQPSRIRVFRSLSRKIDETFQKVSFQAETDLASGLTLRQGLVDLDDTVYKALVHAVKGQGGSEGGKTEHQEVPKKNKTSSGPESPILQPTSPETQPPQKSSSTPTGISAGKGEQKDIPPSRQETSSVKQSERTWKVPVTKNQLTPEQIKQGVRQHSIGLHTLSLGMVNWIYLPDGICEVSVVPEHPVPSWRGPIQTFLVGKFLEGERRTHHEEQGFDFELRQDDEGMLQAILIHGRFQENKVKEIISAVDWALKRVNEPPKFPPKLDRSQVGSPVR